jgi:penicillin-binding protein 1C
LKRWRRRARRLLLASAALGVLAYGLALVLAWALPLPERLAVPGSVVVSYADGSPAHVFLAPDDRWRVPVSLDDVDPAYLDALVALEDARFWWHPGVDPIAIARAAWTNLTRGRVVSGASTITMQLVRVLEPRPRTLGSKAIEAFRAFQLERHHDKREILAAYLTFVPYGRNLEGVEVGSLAYFGHTARDLSADEIATLLAVPQRPGVRFPSPRNAARLRAARDEIGARLRPLDVLPEVGLSRLGKQPVPDRLLRLPREAPHAAAWLRARNPDVLRIPTTLERGAQRAAQRVLAEARREKAAQGIYNGAIVVIEHDSGDVRALVGNFDFWDDDNAGQIAGFDVARSAGSTLKPLLYAMAVERGEALPGFLVPDIPVTYGSYSPVNYDERFNGLVTLEEALSRSLNVPFVDLLADVGVEPFVARLRALGAAHLNETPGWYGLSAAVGGAELTPLELASIYATLARGGVYRPARVAGGEPAPSRRVFDAGAVELTRRALTRRDRPDFPDRRRWTGGAPRIFWKTGTSFGHRDAWSAGAGGRYAAAVWLGNFDNRPSVHLVGADAAAPLLFDLMDALGDDRTEPAAFAEDGLAAVEVCSWSGRLPHGACPHTEVAYALAHRVPTERCPHHVEIEVDVRSGRAVTPRCRAGRETDKRVFLSLPAQVRRWLADGARRLPSPPTWDTGCAVEAGRAPPRILSPVDGQVALLVPGLPADAQEIPLSARGAPGARLSWFVDGTFLGTVPAEQRLWWTPAPGRHSLVVTDDSGLSDERALEVRTLP